MHRLAIILKMQITILLSCEGPAHDPTLAYLLVFLPPQEHRLSIFDVAVWYSGPEASTPSLNRLASFQHSGAVTATKAADLGNGSVLLATASDEGTICRLRMQVPTHPGSSPESINLKGEDLDEAMLKPCVDAHTTSIAAMDLHQGMLLRPYCIVW